MNRKRNDFEQNEQNCGSSIKRMKNPFSIAVQNNSNHDKNSLSELDHEQNQSKLTNGYGEKKHHLQAPFETDLSVQSSMESCPNRKRRARTNIDGPGSNLSSDASATYILPNNNSQARKKSDLSCVVCYGLAHGYNFDAISCESCKAFFRRNALYNTDRLKCRRDGACEITLETRRRCKSCRLKKCFAVGMKKEWILTEEEKQNKKRRIEENRRLRLSNGNTDGESMNETNFIEPKTSPGTVDKEFQNVVLDPSAMSTSKSFSALNNGDVIANVVTAFNEGFQLNPTSYGWSYPLAKKLTALCQIMIVKNTTALRLISFYKRLHEFDSLHEHDKVNLVKNNLAIIFFYHASLGYDPITDIYHEGIPSNDTLLYGSDIRQAHGHDIHARCVGIMRSLHSIVQLDKRIMQLALIIMLFTQGLSTSIHFKDVTFVNPDQILRAQNFYVEHLWIFMEKYYGIVKTIRTFLALNSKYLLIQTLIGDIEEDLHESFEPHQVPPILRTVMNFP